MNSKECNFSFETIFERTSDEFRRNVIRPNDLPRKLILWKVFCSIINNIFSVLIFNNNNQKILKHNVCFSSKQSNKLLLLFKRKRKNVLLMMGWIPSLEFVSTIAHSIEAFSSIVILLFKDKKIVDDWIYICVI